MHDALRCLLQKDFGLQSSNAPGSSWVNKLLGAQQYINMDSIFDRCYRSKSHVDGKETIAGVTRHCPYDANYTHQ